MAAPWRFRTKLVQGPPGPTGKITVTATWTPGLIASGATASITIAVTGAALGMVALGAFSLALPAGVVPAAAVTASNTVVVSLLNLSGSPQTLGAGTATAEVLTS